MMADILRTLKNHPDFLECNRNSFDRGITKFTERKKKHYQNSTYFGTMNCRVSKKKPLFLIANEFFDALPIEQFFETREQFFKRTVQFLNNNLTYGLEKNRLSINF